MSDFVLILSLLYCWLSGGSALVLGRAGEKTKELYRQVGFMENNIFLEKSDFLAFFLQS